MGSVSDEGVMLGALIIQIGQAAVATTNTLAAIKIAADQYKLGKGYMKISEDARAHYDSVYAPGEDVEIAAAMMSFRTPVSLEESTTYRARNAANSKFVGHARHTFRALSRYSTGKAAHILHTVAMARAEALVYAQLVGDTIAFTKKQAEEDRKFAKIISALRRGRELAADSIAISQVTANVLDSINFSTDWVEQLPARKPPQPPQMTTGADGRRQMIMGGRNG